MDGGVETWIMRMFFFVGWSGLLKDLKDTIKEELQTTYDNIKDNIKEEYQNTTNTVKNTFKEDNQKNIKLYDLYILCDSYLVFFFSCVYCDYYLL